MDEHKIDFSSMQWVDAGVGIRYKVFVNGNQQLRLVEFSEGFQENDWCVKGHAGIVIDGEFATDFNGRIEHLRKGDITLIPPGESNKHKAIVGAGQKATILLFEVIESMR